MPKNKNTKTAPKTAPKNSTPATKKTKKPKKTADGGKSHVYKVNKKKLEQLKKARSAVRTGGKGSVRRKKKNIRKSSNANDQKLEQTLKKLNVRPIPEIEEANFFMDDKTVMRFTKPEVKHNMNANTIIVKGAHEQKPLQEVLPLIYDQLGKDQLGLLKELAEQYQQKEGEVKSDDLAGLENIQIPNDEEGEKKKEKKEKEEKED